ncbi:ATP-binding protein [Lyngbya aestuarii]|uniref:ATP-binding protein n=1 Tax=Lyngbya aestuarii TaxID=118322 RepID=UPI001EF14D15|nr:anti-sigma regulatory factor [Lyngbya aestuarii]
MGSVIGRAKLIVDVGSILSVIEFQGSEPLLLPFKAQLQAPNTLDALSDILSWFARLQHPSVPSSIWIRCQLALAEGFTNAVRHAHQNLSSDVTVEIEVALSDSQIEIRVWDYGPPFNLMEKLQLMPPQINKSAGGGRGLKLMRDIADYLNYEPTSDGRNCLLIVKNYQHDD